MNGWKINVFISETEFCFPSSSYTMCFCFCVVSSSIQSVRQTGWMRCCADFSVAWCPVPVNVSQILALSCCPDCSYSYWKYCDISTHLCPDHTTCHVLISFALHIHFNLVERNHDRENEDVQTWCQRHSCSSPFPYHLVHATMSTDSPMHTGNTIQGHPKSFRSSQGKKEAELASKWRRSNTFCPFLIPIPAPIWYQCQQRNNFYDVSLLPRLFWRGEEEVISGKRILQFYLGETIILLRRGIGLQTRCPACWAVEEAFLIPVSQQISASKHGREQQKVAHMFRGEENTARLQGGMLTDVLVGNTKGNSLGCHHFSQQIPLPRPFI